LLAVLTEESKLLTDALDFVPEIGDNPLANSRTHQSRSLSPHRCHLFKILGESLI